MTEEIKTKPVETKAPPSLSDFRVEKARRFNLKKIIIGFVFAASFITAMQNSLICIPFAALALWMSAVKSD